MPGSSRPSDLCLVLAALTPPLSDDGAHGWLSADEVRGNLEALGFDCTAQQVGSWLKRVMRLDLPPIESRREWGWTSYRVTPCGETWLHNKLPSIWFAQRRSYDQMMRSMEVAP